MQTSIATLLMLRRYHQAPKAQASAPSCSAQERALSMVEDILCQMLQALREATSPSLVGRSPGMARMASSVAPALPFGMSSPIAFPKPAIPDESDEDGDEEGAWQPARSGWSPMAPAVMPQAVASARYTGSTVSDALYSDAAKRLGVSMSALKAVAHVESNGKGMLKSGKPQILFEAHVFARYTGGRYNQSHPHLSSQRWDKSLYGRGGEHQWQRLEAAQRLDPRAALMATSFGRFQIMGFNHKAAGYPTVEAFAKAMQKGEGEQLNALCNFLASNPKMLNALRREDWHGFARAYNGPEYAANRYHLRLAEAERHFAARRS